MRSSPFQRLPPSISDESFACGVIAIGRVWGTAIGTEARERTELTLNRRTTSWTAVVNASQRLSGSGPRRKRYGAICWSRISRTFIRGASYCS